MSNSKRRRTVYTVLLSVCLFLGIICACLLVALVLIGKHLALQQHCIVRQTIYNATDNNTKVRLGDKSEDDSEISVKILVNDNKVWNSPWRLPADVIPLDYNLSFNPNTTSGLFTGTNNVTISLKDRRDHLIVNSDRLNVTVVKLFDDKGAEIEILDHHGDEIHQLQVVDLEDSLEPGLYYLYFEFSGSLKNYIGFYSSSYLDEHGNRR